jgi:DNA-binding NtrC family response regulator
MTRILVADDEKVIADSLVKILAQAGYDASAAYSGEQAVETALQLKPDFLLTDVIMGLMSGVVAGMIVRRSLPDCRVILFSGQANVAPLLKTAEENGHRFELLAKPVAPDKLLDYLANNARRL